MAGTPIGRRLELARSLLAGLLSQNLTIATTRTVRYDWKSIRWAVLVRNLQNFGLGIARRLRFLVRDDAGYVWEPKVDDIVSQVLAGLTLTIAVLLAGWLYRALHNWRGDRDIRRRLLLRSEIVSNRLDSRLLADFYNRSASVGGLGLFPATIGVETKVVQFVTRREWIGLRIPLTNVRTTLNAKLRPMAFHDAIGGADKSFVTSLRVRRSEENARNGVELWNAPIYRITKVSIEQNNMDLEFAMDEFMNHYDSNCLMELELEEALIRTGKDPLKILANKPKYLPLRSAIAGDYTKLFNLNSRLCAGGICAVFAVAREEDYLIPIVTRSKKVAIGSGRLSLVPQGLHQPLSTVMEEHSLIHTVYRELYEELLGGKEVVHGDAKLPVQWYFESSSALTWIDRNISSCTMEVTTFGFNLVNGNYECGILLAINDPAFWKNFERSVSAGWEGKFYSLLSTKDSRGIQDLLNQDHWVPEARATLIQGLIRLAEIEPEKVALPYLKIHQG